MRRGPRAVKDGLSEGPCTAKGGPSEGQTLAMVLKCAILGGAHFSTFNVPFYQVDGNFLTFAGKDYQSNTPE